jgi:anhydro-N-acetylmuramic acid kinase
MSGTSLDGLDIAYCSFTHKKGKWQFSIVAADTVAYPNKWLKKLQSAPALSGLELLKLHNEYGTYSGEQVTGFIKKRKVKSIDLVSSHGHTIFHQPKEKFTFQLGHGAAIAAACQQTVINDFRSLDVALNGQGAPLVPIGDMLLFSEYQYCINLGGFANISFNKKDKRIAFDICPVNIILNYLAQTFGKEYDKDGAIAAKGKTDKVLLHKLNALAFYKVAPPKSLGREWLENEFLPLLNKATCSNTDKLTTVVEHITGQIRKVFEGQTKGNVLLTGGGAFNSYLIDQLKTSLPGFKVIVPEESIVKYKEALVFAFLGVLRLREEDNCLSSVTGADRNNKGGTIWLI